MIGWDAADWQIINPLMDSGQMPNLEGLVNRGCIGNLATLYPCLSPILWTTIATGHTADRHGILGFVEPLPDSSGVRLSSSCSRKTRALWNIASLQGLRSVVVNWYASHPAEPINGICVSNEAFKAPKTRDLSEWQLPEGCVYPPELTSKYSSLRLHPAELLPVDLKPLIPLMDHIDHREDARPSKLAELVAKTVSVQSIFTAALMERPWDFAAVFFDALDVGAHIFMPYCPPRLANISERDFALYQQVVPELYKFHDQLLGTLLASIDQETRVLLVSDHGFENGPSRPFGQLQFQSWQEVEQGAEAAEWHRHLGVLAMAGPGIKQDERIYGATLLDVAPTALEMLGLPKGADMPGRVLKEAFWDNRCREVIDSWEHVQGGDGQHLESARYDAVSAVAEWQVLADLGYLPNRCESGMVETAAAELDFNLAAVHLHHGRPKDALPILQSLDVKFPNTPRFMRALASCHHLMRDSRRALGFTDRLDQMGLGNLDTDMIAAKCLGAIGESDKATARFQKIAETYKGHAIAWCMWGEYLLDISDGNSAWDKFQEAVRLTPDLFRGQLGKAKAALLTGRPQEALAAAQEASKIQFYSPMAHFHRGAAHEQLGQVNDAVFAYQKAVEQKPDFYHAHQRLAEIFQHTGDSGQAFRHTQAAQQLLRDMDSKPVERADPGSTKPADWNGFIDDLRNGLVTSLQLFSVNNSCECSSLPNANSVINVVSGLPRSGTSLMMQLIEACGIVPLIDSARLADENNPRGYYEYEPVKAVGSETRWLELAVGKVVKVVYPNLLELPTGFSYRVFFLIRDLDEVLQSQSAMLVRNGKDTILDHSRLISRWRSSIPGALQGFQKRTGSQVIVVPFAELFRQPDTLGQRLNNWLGLQGGVHDLSGIVDHSLHRQRREA